MCCFLLCKGAIGWKCNALNNNKPHMDGIHCSIYWKLNEIHFIQCVSLRCVHDIFSAAIAVNKSHTHINSSALHMCAVCTVLLKQTKHIVCVFLSLSLRVCCVCVFFFLSSIFYFLVGWSSSSSSVSFTTEC